MSTSDIITQVSDGDDAPAVIGAVPRNFILELRGRRFFLSREELSQFPECIIFCLSSGYSHSDVSGENLTTDEEVTVIEFSPKCFEYILRFITETRGKLEPASIPISNFPELFGLNVDDSDIDLDVSEQQQAQSTTDPTGIPAVLLERPSIILLKEDIEYYCMADDNLSIEDTRKLKIAVGKKITASTSIFDDMIDASNENIDSPEYHLLQMLCAAGYEVNDKWAFREQEPGKCIVSSLQLKKLDVSEGEADSDHAQTLQKLLLFYKKPARKCWWNKFRFEEPNLPKATVHARKVWTLELSIIGLSIHDFE